MSDFGLEPQWWWLIAATLLAIAELIVPGVFLIWLAAGAALTGFATLIFEPPIAFQFALFALFSLGSVYGGRRYYLRNPVESSDPMLNDRASRLVGKNVEVVSPIESGTGRVRVGDSVWNCRGPDCPAGSRVLVKGAEGTCLLVERVETPELSGPG